MGKKTFFCITLPELFCSNGSGCKNRFGGNLRPLLGSENNQKGLILTLVLFMDLEADGAQWATISQFCINLILKRGRFRFYARGGALLQKRTVVRLNFTKIPFIWFIFKEYIRIRIKDCTKNWELAAAGFGQGLLTGLLCLCLQAAHCAVVEMVLIVWPENMEEREAVVSSSSTKPLRRVLHIC
jgi:hypothetical protein